MGHTGTRNCETDSQHRLLEELAILALGDRLRVRPNQLHAVTSERAVAVQLHCGVQRSLTAHRREDRIRFFAFENRFDYFRSYWLDISTVCEFRISHDRGRIRVYEYDLIAFLAQRFAR